MENKKKEDSYSLFDDNAPPVPVASEIINKNKDNLNNIKINESNFNLLSNNQSDNIKKELDKKSHPINNNKISQQNPHLNLYNNNNNINNYQNNNYLNYNYQQQKYDINKNIIINKDNTDNLSNFKIDIEPDILNNLNKEALLDIIIFIQKYCKLKIDPKFTKLTHYIFRIIKNKKKIINTRK